jgi:predicted MFS family arabinose efflux permease
VYALIEQPSNGWGAPQILVPLVAGLILLVAFVFHEHRTREPMLTLELFRQRNFAVGNAATLGVYGGLSVVPFFLVLFLQQVVGYSPLEAGVSLLPITVLMFTLSRRFGALADRVGPRLFMGLGPLIAGLGIALLARADAHADYPGVILPAVLVFGVGLSLTVAPLTATVLGGVDERHAGMASAINNAVARIAGLLAVAAIGAAVASQFASTLDARAARLPLGPAARAAVAQARGRALVVRVPAGVDRAQAPAVHAALTSASVDAFRLAMELTALLVMIGGALSAAGIRNPRRAVPAADCPGGAVVGASRSEVPAAA